MACRTQTCPMCRRILFPNRSGQLPPHKVPEPLGTYPNAKAVPLTRADAPWCRTWSA